MEIKPTIRNSLRHIFSDVGEGYAAAFQDAPGRTVFDPVIYASTSISGLIAKYAFVDRYIDSGTPLHDFTSFASLAMAGMAAFGVAMDVNAKRVEGRNTRLWAQEFLKPENTF